MTQREKRIRNFIIFLAILAIFGLERLYNNSDRFQVKAKDASEYGIVEAKVLTKEKLEDFEYIYKVLEDNYPYFEINERLNGVDWLKNRRQYRRLIKNTKTDAEYFVAMQRIMGDLNNSHVKVLTNKDFKWYFKYYYEKLRKEDNIKMLPLYNAITDPYVTYRYMFEGNVDDVKLYQEPNLVTRTFEEDKTAYMKIKAMAGFGVLEEDFEQIKEFLKEVSLYDKLIIDIRGNSGGEDKYWKRLTELLTETPLKAEYYSFFKDGHRFDNDPYKVEDVTTIKRLDEEILNNFPDNVKTDYDFYKKYTIEINPVENIEFKGKIYLLVDKNISSEGENFASFSKDTGFATLVGEKTSGEKAFEDLPITYLRNTKFAIRYSRELAMNKEGTINMETKTSPDIKIDATIVDNLNSDEAIKAVIED